jgi:hypothetical protein
MTTKPPKRVWPDESARKRDEERTRRFYLDRGMAPEKVEELLREREASWHRFRIIAEERERTKAEYGVFFAEVQAIVTRHDPIGVIFEDAPEAAETEYQVEAGTIIPQLRGAHSLDDVRRIVDGEFDRWFGVGTSHDPRTITRLRAIAGEIWDAWNRFQPQ